MSDIVERLRWWGAKKRAPKSMPTLPADCLEAANEIERLHANIDRLTGNPVDHRYWEGRYRDEKVENEKLVKVLEGIEEEIFGNGAPLGSKAYFEIRKLAVLRHGGANGTA